MNVNIRTPTTASSLSVSTSECLNQASPPSVLVGSEAVHAAGSYLHLWLELLQLL